MLTVRPVYSTHRIMGEESLNRVKSQFSDLLACEPSISASRVPTIWDYQQQLVENAVVVSSPPRKEKSLGPSYQPGLFDVICAKGKEAKQHTGNRRFRIIIDMNLQKYREAGKSKTIKSRIVTDIVDAIRSSSPGGGFIKFSKGEWHLASDHLAREKVGQCFRDRLFTEYKSSSRAKNQRRKIEIVNQGLAGSLLPSPQEGRPFHNYSDDSGHGRGDEFKSLPCLVLP